MPVRLRIKRRLDRVEHGVQFEHHVAVPEAQDTEPELRQCGVSFPVHRVVRVSDAVDLDDQPFRVADEVDDETIDRLLTSELPFEVVPKTGPQQDLRLGHAAT